MRERRRLSYSTSWYKTVQAPGSPWKHIQCQHIQHLLLGSSEQPRRQLLVVIVKDRSQQRAGHLVD